MKIARILIAAGVALAAVGGSTAASAHDYRQDRYEHRGDRYDRHDRHDRGYYDRHHREYRGWNRGHGWNRYHRHCWTEWRHHHRVRVCR